MDVMVTSQTRSKQMTNRRRLAYFAAFKFFFQRALVGGTDRRTAWNAAKNDAAAYAFLAPTENLRVWIPAWAD